MSHNAIRKSKDYVYGIWEYNDIKYMRYSFQIHKAFKNGLKWQLIY